MSTVTNFLDFTINAVLHPTFIRKLCYKQCRALYPLHSFSFSKLCLLHRIAAELQCLLDTASKFALFSVSGLKDEKLIKKQIYIKTEKCKLYSRVFWIFLPNFIKINHYNSELYRFKFGAFFETHCSYSLTYLFSWACCHAVRPCTSHGSSRQTHQFAAASTVESTRPIRQPMGGGEHICITSSNIIIKQGRLEKN